MDDDRRVTITDDGLAELPAGTCCLEFYVGGQHSMACEHGPLGSLF